MFDGRHSLAPADRVRLGTIMSSCPFGVLWQKRVNGKCVQGGAIDPMRRRRSLTRDADRVIGKEIIEPR